MIRVIRVVYFDGRGTQITGKMELKGRALRNLMAQENLMARH